jgi:tRNA(Ile2) C34 agmatinyltransferase TiaS
MRAWNNHGHDIMAHDAKIARRREKRLYDNQYVRKCSTCGWKLHAKGRKYWTCLTCGKRTEKNSPDAPAPQPLVWS